MPNDQYKSFAPVLTYHQQSLWYYCAPACIQMVLQTWRGSPDASSDERLQWYNDTLVHQDNIWDVAVSYTQDEPDVTFANYGPDGEIHGWAVCPNGMWRAMNALNASTGPCWRLIAKSSEPDVSKRICENIYHKRQPAVALVFGPLHWVLVFECRTNVAPDEAREGDFVIDGFMIRDPLPAIDPTNDMYWNLNHGHSYDHYVGDLCSFDKNEVYIPYGAWVRDYLTGVPTESGSRWADTGFIALVDPDSKNKKRSYRRNVRHKVKKPSAGKKEFIGKKKITSLAVKALKDNGLYERKLWSKELGKTTPGLPILVMRIDRNEGYYYLVPFQTSSTRTPIVVRLDAFSGQFLGASYRGGKLGHFFGDTDGNRVLNKVLGKTFTSASSMAGFTVKKHTAVYSPVMVWKPCRESMSPFMPFHMVVVGNERLFIRYDGQVVTRLRIGPGGI